VLLERVFFEVISAFATCGLSLGYTSNLFDIPLFDAVIVAIGSDFENNLITTAALKALGARLVTCKALSEHQKENLLGVGADRVIRPESNAGQRLATELIAPNLLEQISFGEGQPP